MSSASLTLFSSRIPSTIPPIYCAVISLHKFRCPLLSKFTESGHKHRTANGGNCRSIFFANKGTKIRQFCKEETFPIFLDLQKWCYYSRCFYFSAGKFMVFLDAYKNQFHPIPKPIALSFFIFSILSRFQKCARLK